MQEFFRKFASAVAKTTGSVWVFIAALVSVILWLLTGPLFQFSSGWQLVINTATTIITFLMVFIIQNSQNRDVKAIHLKLDELVRTQKLARNSLLGLEDVPDAELNELHKEFQVLHQKYEREVHRRRSSPSPDSQ